MKKSLLFSILGAASVSLMAQVPVSTSVEKKNPVLEDITGDKCVYCPDGAKVADQLRAATGGKMVVIGNQGGSFSSGVLEIPEGGVINGLSGASNVGWPCGNINRRKFEGKSYTAHSRYPNSTQNNGWAENAALIKAENSPVNIGAEAYYVEGSNKLNIDVAVYYTATQTAKNYLNILVLQDSILYPQTGGSNFYPARIDPGTGKYWHMDVLRDYVTAFTPPTKLGDVINNTTQGDRTEFSYEWTIPASVGTFPVVKEHLYVVAFVASAGTFSEIHTGINVEVNARPVGVNEVHSMKDLEIYPNPFNTAATIEFNLEENTQVAVNMYDVTGKLVHNIPATNYSIGNHRLPIDGSNLESGMYYVNFIAPDGVMTRSLVLNK